MPNTLAWVSETKEIRSLCEEARFARKRIGLVPTMGNLHAGHASLIEFARKETDFVVVTIFVNPIQFVAGEDYDRYPRTPDQDRIWCQQAGADVIFAPTVETMYPKGHKTRVQVTGIEEPLCGHHRPGHFVGVATVVTKLFHLVPADVAFFGAKDFQQASLIRQMVRDLDFPMEIRVCPTIREPDGLAMSSRNAYLSPVERKEALALSQTLEQARKQVREGVRDVSALKEEAMDRLTKLQTGKIDYVEFVDPESFIPVERVEGPTLLALAVRFGRARLIDNTLLGVES